MKKTPPVPMEKAPILNNYNEKLIDHASAYELKERSFLSRGKKLIRSGSLQQAFLLQEILKPYREER